MPASKYRFHPAAEAELKESSDWYEDRRFPYALVYRELTPDEIEIVAVAHFKRRPKYWSRR